MNGLGFKAVRRCTSGRNKGEHHGGKDEGGSVR
jgi:hypothetical protein